MTNQEYPYNLIRAIYGDQDTDDTHVRNVDIPNFYRTLDLLPNIERTAILRRFQDYATLKESGRSIGESSSSTTQIIRRGLKRLRRFGDHHYFDINQATAAPYPHNEIEPHIGELQLNTAVETCLSRAGYNTIQQVRPLSEEQLKAIPHFDNQGRFA